MEEGCERMISELEMNARIFVRKGLMGDEIRWFVEKDGNEIYSSPNRTDAYRRMREEREKVDVKEALYDAGIVVRPETLRKKQESARRRITVQNPQPGDFPIAWRVYDGVKLIGAYRSQWEAEQFRNRVILNGGYGK